MLSPRTASRVSSSVVSDAPPNGITLLPHAHQQFHHLPATVQPSLLLLQGKLLRRDRAFLTWKWRDFYLERHRLQYFNEKGYRKGEIVITSTTPVLIRILNTPKPFSFLVFIKDEKLTLAAATQTDRQKWIDVFRDVFHATIEDLQDSSSGSKYAVDGSTPPLQSHNGSVTNASGGSPPIASTANNTISTVEKQGKRTKPTFLSVPDVNSDDEDQTTQKSSRRNLLGGFERSASMSGIDRDRVRSGSKLMEGGLRRQAHLVDVDISTQGWKNFVAIKELYSNVTFPRSLVNGDLLMGVGPLVRRMGWTDERILAVGFYVDVHGACRDLQQRFHGRTLASLYGDQAFYDYMMLQAKFRRQFVITSRKRVSKSVLIALLHDELAPRMSGGIHDALDTFLGFLEKSLRKAQSMVFRIASEGSCFEFQLRGQPYPPIASTLLCQCIQGIFFDVNAIQQDAKRRLIERFPWLWGIEEGVLHVQNVQAVPPLTATALIPMLETDDEGEDEIDTFPRPTLQLQETDDEEEGGDEEKEPLEEAMGNVPRLSMKELLHKLDDEEHERMRREQTNLGARFGPLVNRDTNAYFDGNLEGTMLLGTCSHQFTLPESNDGTVGPSHLCDVTVGLYIDSGRASEALLKYKGLSVGSILQDPDFFVRFAEGSFAKHLVCKVSMVDHSDVVDNIGISISALFELFTARLRRRGSVSLNVSDTHPGSNEVGIRALMIRVMERDLEELKPNDVLVITIHSDGKMTLDVHRQVGDIEDDQHKLLSSCAQEEKVLAFAPLSTLLQGVFYGYHTINPTSRAQLMERLPCLLDLAKDDLAHTYHDEIQLLKENYNRQLPENRLKAGYLLISFEKKRTTTRKALKNENGEVEELTTITVTPSKWSKRWCRLDGSTFSVFSHKRSKKSRELVDLTNPLCHVSEITSVAAVLSSELAPFAASTQNKKHGTRPSIRIGITKPNGEILALKTESIFEGVEWLDALVEASEVRNRLTAGSAMMIETHMDDEDAVEIDDECKESYDMDNGQLGSVELEGFLAPAYEEHPTVLSGVINQSIVSNEHTDHGKHGSLLAWVREDTRHALIFSLLIFVAWIVTQEPNVRSKNA